MSLDVRIVTKKGVELDQKADSVSATNSVGPFDILEEHEWFVSEINGDLTVRRADKIIWQNKIKQGICVSRNNTVTVFVDQI